MRRASKRFFVPEVVQTSNMDCGPAALKCLLEGYGISASYGRLREACQTGIDGTSIDTMEIVANQLGLQAEQILLPLDHVFLPEAKALPALVVVLLPNGMTHFVVVWRRHGNLLQIMDPAVGRRWVGVDRFASEVYGHKMAVAAEDWLEFTRSDDFRVALRARLRHLGIRSGEQDRLLENLLTQEDWRRVAAFDASVRLVRSLVKGKGVSRSRGLIHLVQSLAEKPDTIPNQYWSAFPLNEQIMTRGAVLVRVTGRRTEAAQQHLGVELEAALKEKTASPGARASQSLFR